MKNGYNQTLLNFEQEEQIIQSILSAVGSWIPKFHRFALESPTGQLLDSLGLQDEVYLSISPSITVKRKDVSREYQEINIDVSKHKAGRQDCEHMFVELYWEVGGGGMDSGTPHRYILCSKCAHAYARPIIPVFETTRSFWSKLFNRPRVSP